MKKNDSKLMRYLSKEIERVMKEDTKLIQKRKDERKQNLINTYKKKQKQEIEHFKSSYETILVNIQNKWSARLEEERKKMNIVDARNEKKNNVIITEQKINVNVKEPEGSLKAKVNPRSKTNRELKGQNKDSDKIADSFIIQDSNHKESDQLQDD